MEVSEDSDLPTQLSEYCTEPAMQINNIQTNDVRSPTNVNPVVNDAMLAKTLDINQKVGKRKC